MSGQPIPEMYRFQLHRDRDETGVSGTGIVAEGVRFSNGWCALTWLTHTTSVAFYPSISNVVYIHGHQGKTRIVWLDEPLVGVKTITEHPGYSVT